MTATDQPRLGKTLSANLNISRYISTAAVEAAVDLTVTHSKLVDLEATISAAREKHDQFLRDLGLPLLPGSEH